MNSKQVGLDWRGRVAAVIDFLNPIAIAQKLNSPFLRQDKEIDPTAFVTKFGER